MSSRFLAPFVLGLAGCYPNFFAEDVAYEVQVRDPGGGFVEDAKVAIHAPELDRPVAAFSNSRGKVGLEFEMPFLRLRHRSHEVLLPWIEVVIEKEGYESHSMGLDRIQFIEEERNLRRIEGVVLKRKQP